MDKVYAPHDIERRIYERWESQGWFAPRGTGTPYCIMMPPPNVTGTLHMGHAFQHTLMDALIRYHRMRGDNTLWQPGTDHAGIATQMVVERQLEAAGQDAARPRPRGRSSSASGSGRSSPARTITRPDAPPRRLGRLVARALHDGRRPVARGASRCSCACTSEGLIYRGKRLVNWDPVLRHGGVRPRGGERGGGRPALAHPLSARRRQRPRSWSRRRGPRRCSATSRSRCIPTTSATRTWSASTCALPLTGPRRSRSSPTTTSTATSAPACVKITPGARLQRLRGRPAPRAAADQHLHAATRSSTTTRRQRYRGLDRFEARKRVLADLEAPGLLERDRAAQADGAARRPHRRGASSRCSPTSGSSKIGAARRTPGASQAVEDGAHRASCRRTGRNTYTQWMRNIQDWCISRQLWWGHRIPAWYDEQGNVYVGRNEAEVRAQPRRWAPACALRQDEDVLDTWFSSALWPFSTLGWPDETPRAASRSTRRACWSPASTSSSSGSRA